MASDSSTATEGGNGGGGTGNSYSQRNSLPWAEVVRGGAEPEPITPRSPTASPSFVMTEQNLPLSDQLTVTELQTKAAVESNPEGFEGSDNENASGVKKSVWNKSSANGVEEPVMGGASWPALSELTRPLPKSTQFQSESSSSKSTSDGSSTLFQAPVISQPPQKPVKTHPIRQRSLRRGEGAGGGYSRPQPPPPPPMPPYPLFEMSYGASVPYDGSSFVPARPVAGVGSHSHPVHDHPSNRKRNNVGPRPRGDRGPYLNNGHGGRRGHHDGDWRGLRSRGVIPHQGAPPPPPPPPPPPRGYMQQAHLVPAPFIAPHLIRPFGAPMGYEMAPAPAFVYVPTLPPESYRGPPIFPLVSPPSIIVPGTDPPLLSVSILRQIEYYFSDANLVKDNYLRSNMDAEGWVPVTLIAGFPRVQSLTIDIQMILSSLRESTVVEVQGETVRRRNDWRKWVKPPVNFPQDSSSQSPRASTDGPTIESLQKLALDETTITDRNDTHNKEVASNIDPVGWTDSSNVANTKVTPNDDQYLNPESSTSSYQDL